MYLTLVFIIYTLWGAIAGWDRIYSLFVRVFPTDGLCIHKYSHSYHSPFSAVNEKQRKREWSDKLDLKGFINAVVYYLKSTIKQ